MQYTIQIHNTIQCNAVQNKTIIIKQYITIQLITGKYNAIGIQYNAIQYDVIYSLTQYNPMQYNTL